MCVLVMVLGAGCGRLGFDTPAGPAGMTPGGDDSPPGMPVNLQPQVCGAQMYSTIDLSKAVDLSIAEVPGGAAVFAIASMGGPLAGFTVDVDGNLTRPLRTVVPGTFSASAAAYVDSTLITAAVSSSQTLVQIVPADLSSYSQIANVEGEYVSKQALVHASADRVTPTVCSAGLTVNPFDPAWKPMASQLSVTTAQSTGIAATAVGSEALVAFSTEDATATPKKDTCYVEQLATQATGFGSSQPFACAAPRLANDGTTSSRLVFAAPDGVRTAGVAVDQLDPTTALVAPGATAPRIVFDGQHYWTSYRDATGTIVVGVTSGAAFLTTPIAGVAPTTDATYELAMIGGAPWVFAVEAGGVSAHKLCLGN
jgi:hypothetical protein